MTVVGVSTHKRRVGLIGDFAEAVVEHDACYRLYIVVYNAHHGSSQLFGHGVVLEVDIDACRGGLFVAAYYVDGFYIIGYGKVGAFGRILGHFDGREEFFDASFHLVDVDVTDNDDSLIVGTVPFVVVVAQVLVGEVHHYFHRTDRQTVGILASCKHLGQDFLYDTPVGVVAGTPLFVYHTALAVYLIVFEQDGARPVVQYEEAGVYQSGVGRGYVRYAIYRLVESGVGIDVGAEFYTVVFEIVEHCFPGEVLQSVESHVLQEVCQTALVLFFENRTYALCDVKFGAVFGCLVVADVIGESVVEYTITNLRVDGQLLRHRVLFLCDGRHSKGYDGGCQETFQCFYVHHLRFIKG